MTVPPPCMRPDTCPSAFGSTCTTGSLGPAIPHLDWSGIADGRLSLQARTPVIRTVHNDGRRIEAGDLNFNCLESFCNWLLLSHLEAQRMLEDGCIRLTSSVKPLITADALAEHDSAYQQWEHSSSEFNRNCFPRADISQFRHRLSRHPET